MITASKLFTTCMSILAVLSESRGGNGYSICSIGGRLPIFWLRLFWLRRSAELTSPRVTQKMLLQHGLNSSVFQCFSSQMKAAINQVGQHACGLTEDLKFRLSRAKVEHTQKQTQRCGDFGSRPGQKKHIVVLFLNECQNISYGGAKRCEKRRDWSDFRLPENRMNNSFVGLRNDKTPS
jgi:hypothetical protein